MIARLQFLDYLRVPERFLLRLRRSGDYFLRAVYELFTLRPLLVQARETFAYLLTQIRPKLLWMFADPQLKLFYMMLSLWMELPFVLHEAPDLLLEKHALLLPRHTRLDALLPDLAF